MPGILFAFIAATTWGFNDFFIQKETKKFGSNLTLFVFSVVAVVVLAPFVDFKAITNLDNRSLMFLVLVPGLFSVVGTYLEFQSMKDGPISVIENLLTFEIPISVVIALAIGERLEPLTLAIIIVDVFGFIALSPSFKTMFDFSHIKTNYFLLAALAAMFFGFTNVSIGISSIEFGFVEALFFVNIVSLLFSTIGLITLRLKSKIRIRESFSNVDRYLIAIAIFDLVAWLSFTLSTSAGNIAISITISQGYTVLTTALGVLVNKEKLNWHQGAGIFIVTSCSIALGLLNK